MADDIKQTLGFDVSQALEALAKLDGAFQSFEARLRSVADTLKGFNSSSAKTAAALGSLANTSGSTSATVATSTQRMASAFQSSSAQSIAHVDRLTTSVKLLSRIVFTQAVVRALSTLRNAFQSTAESAIQFQRQVALIRTIDDSKQSFDQLSASIVNASNQFNIPLLETAEGLYNTISNQVGNAAESMQFLTEAAKFAKATNSTLNNSVDLLSGALKSYNLTVEDTNKVSGIFFKTIDLGRVTAQSLGNAFGRVGPVASDLGVSLEETGAAIAAISVKGSNTAESLTQFRGILTGLLKPSKDMKAALNEMGFSSAEVAIQTLGLSGVLRELSTRTGGSSTELAKLFSNVRALSGSTSLTSDNLVTFANNIDEMTAAGRKFNDAKFLQATATDAERVTKEINKLKNAFTVDLGQAVLKSTADLSQFVGGADALTESVKAAGPALVGLTGSLLLFRNGLVSANAQALGLSKTLGGLVALAPALAGLAKSVAGALQDKRAAAVLAPIEQLTESNAQALERYKNQLAEARDADNKASKDRAQNALEMTRSLNKQYLQQQKDLEAAQKVIKSLQSKSKLTQDQAFQLGQARATVRNTPNPLANVQGVSQLSNLLDKQISNPDQLARGLTEAEKKAEDLRAKLTQALSIGPQAKNLQTEINAVFDQLSKTAGSRNTFPGEFANALRSQFDSLVVLFKEVQKDGKVTGDELNLLIEAQNQFRKNALEGDNPTVGIQGFSTSIVLLDEALNKMQALNKLPTPNIGAIQTELQSIEGVLLLFQPASNAMKEGEQASANIANNYQRAASAAERINSVQVSPVSRALGGSIPWEHFASGGIKGTDTIPAMLSKGEFVVNAQQSARFLPQLQAINAGIVPSFRSGDTSNTSISVGDIVVQGGGDPEIAARKVMEAIRRERRRGTGRI